VTEEALFDLLLNSPDTERAAILDRECADGPALRARVEALLRADATVDDPSVTATHDPAGTRSHVLSEPVGEAGQLIAGKYKLVEAIGEGGMGTVWMAQQTQPVKRAVAVKLIKEGMDSKAVLARFEAERQALAMMDHPNIAKILDGGLHDGRPYFVMELVKGIPITQFCDARKLTPYARLELFIQVCNAIQHAHQKGIIHRDIKPSNVLVALFDDRPVPKVIDFGVAKATGAQLTDRTLMTGFGAVVGTPEYMSPEQASFNQMDVDTRSDIYALGVLLYELLTGSTPVDRKTLGKAALLEILRIVREVEAPRPSAKLSTSDALPTISANRGIEPKKLTGLLRNELDWIMMKALEKDRTRRYETANGFAADVLRYLSGEAVQAHPPSTAYRLKKFVRRNKGQVVAASLVFAALLAGVIGTSVGMVRAENRRIEAEQAKAAEADRAEGERQAKQQALAAVEEERKAKGREADRAEGERKAKEEAQSNLAFAKKGNEILGSVFAGLDPKRNYANVGEFSEALKANLRKAVKDLDGSAIGDALEVASMQNTLGESLLGLDDWGQAIILFEKARATRTAKLGIDHHDTLMSMNSLATGYRDAGKSDLALPLFEETFKLMKAKLGADHPDTLLSMGSLALGYSAAGKPDLALPLFEETFKLRKAKLGADHPDTLQSMNNLASGYHTGGKLDLALPLQEEAVKLIRSTLGADHHLTLASMANLAGIYEDAGKLDLALPLYAETLKLQKARLGANHHFTLASMNNLAAGYYAAGKLDLALPIWEEALKLQKTKLGADHSDTLGSIHNLASCYQKAGKPNLALPLFQEVATSMENRHFQHLHAGTSVTHLIECYEGLKQFDQAEAWRRKWLAVVKERAGADSLPYAGELALLGMNLLQQKKWTDAEPVLRECLAIREKKQPDAWTTFNMQSMLGGALLGQKKYADAEPLLLQGYEGLKKREKTIPPQGAIRLPESLDRLIELYTATNKSEEAKRWRAERAKLPDEKKPEPKK